MLPRLPPAKAAAVRRLGAAADRNASLLGLLLLQSACAALGSPCRLSELVYAPGAKPRLPGGPEFSISHAGGVVGCVAAADGALGLDLEPRGRATAAMLRLVAPAEDLGRLAAGELDPTTYAVSLEAVVKAAGASVAALAEVRLEPPFATLRGVRYGLCAPGIGEETVCVLADSAARGVPALRFLDPAELL